MVLVIVALVLFSAFFVAAEFASVAVRKVRVETLAEEGHGAARLLLHRIGDDRSLDRLVSATQIGITATSLFLGIFGEQSLAAQLTPWLSQLGGMAPAVAGGVASTAVLIGLTIFQVVFAELVPKAVAMRYPETVGFAVIYPMNAFLKAMSWFIDILTAAGTFFLRLLRIPPHYERHIHSPEEIELLIIQGRTRGSIDEEEHRRLRRVLRFADRRVREVMVPRTRMKTIARDAESRVATETLASSEYTRLPVTGVSIDDILGIVHVKDAAMAVARGESFSIEKAVRPAPRVPLAMPMDEVLDVLRKERAQLAVVLDEYGGTAGIVTMENLMEDILGEVQDEFDREVPAFVVFTDREMLVRGDVSLADLADRMDVPL